MTITELKHKLDITWNKMARELCVSTRTLFRYACGDIPTPDSIKKLIKFIWKVEVD